MGIFRCRLVLGFSLFFLSGLLAPSSSVWAADQLKVAAVQYPIDGGMSTSKFFSRITGYVKEARSRGAELVVFPELFIFDLIDKESSEIEQLEKIAQDVTPRLFTKISQLSRKYEISILGGTTPRFVNGEIVNTAYLAFPDGTNVLQDKIFLTPDEVYYGWKPGTELKVFEAPWGKTTILICYDSQFSSLSEMLNPYAPEVLLVPSMTLEKGFHRVRWTAQARAIEHHAFVVATGTVDGKTRSLYPFRGQAQIFTPQENGFPGILAQGPKDQDAIVFGMLDLALLRESRQLTGLYSGRDRQTRTEPIKIVTE